MSKKNDDFFVEKKPWSEVKDQLLGCYLKPYVAKILHTRKPLVYVDCLLEKENLMTVRKVHLSLHLILYSKG